MPGTATNSCLVPVVAGRPGTITRVAGSWAAGSQPPPALIPFDAEAKQALELTFGEALRMGHNYIGTEHILLALLESEADDGPLARLGLGKEATEEWITAAVSAIADATPPG